MRKEVGGVCACHDTVLVFSAVVSTATENTVVCL